MSRTRKSCPCGSGKAYEKCCGKGMVLFSLEQARWRRAGRYLRCNLGEFADQPFFARDAARAQELYLGCLDQKMVDHDDEFTMERCFEWFIFDYELSSGRTIIDIYLEEHLHDLSYWEAVLLKEWTRSRISLYEVTEVLPGQGLVLKELLRKRKIKVYDINAAAEVEAGSILLIRVLKVGKEYEFSTSGLALRGDCKESILKWISLDYQEYLKFKGRKAGNRSWASYLKERAHVINARVMELGFSGTRTKRNSAGKNMLASKAILPVTNWHSIMDSINHSDYFRPLTELRDSSGAFRQAVAAILGKPRRRAEVDIPEKGRKDGVNPPGGGASLRPVLGLMVLTPRYIIINTSSPELLLKCREFLATSFNEEIKENQEHERKRNKNSAGEGESYTWPEPGYAAVAGCVRDGLEALGYSPKQQKGALKLWFDYCSKERPSIRKTAAWAAAVIYTFTRVEMENRVKQDDLAGRYGVSSSTISYRFRLFCKSLDLFTYDCRYSTKKPPGGMRKSQSLQTRL